LRTLWTSRSHFTLYSRVGPTPRPPVGPISPGRQPVPFQPLYSPCRSSPCGPAVVPFHLVFPAGPIFTLEDQPPISPCGLVGPISPVGPIGPISPVGPVGPISPCGTRMSYFHLVESVTGFTCGTCVCPISPCRPQATSFTLRT
jgi:hypothetical protein